MKLLKETSKKYWTNFSMKNRWNATELNTKNCIEHLRHLMKAKNALSKGVRSFKKQSFKMPPKLRQPSNLHKKTATLSPCSNEKLIRHGGLWRQLKTKKKRLANWYRISKVKLPISTKSSNKEVVLLSVRTTLYKNSWTVRLSWKMSWSMLRSNLSKH